MDTFAWAGVAVGGAVIVAWLLYLLWSMLNDSIGRGILLGIGIIAVAAWALGGGVYLLVTKG